ncbi:Endoplasmin [Chlorella vulgaris]
MLRAPAKPGALLLLLLVCGTALQGARGQDSTPEAADAVPETPAAVAAPSAKDRQFREGAEARPFQAEVSRMMDIIIHSLYSNKDIFLRELVSNAADALDKIRFLSLTDKSQLGEGDTAKLEMLLSVDPEQKMISLRDRGVGMTRADLVSNLGTIAKSGTAAFLEQMQKGGDLNLIGQFGVGFYSVYLVADYVEVVTKHNDDVQLIWESKADGSFAISEDREGAPLGRGTQINIYLKDSCQEYLQEDKLKELVQRYSEFINFPIYMLTHSTVDKEVPFEGEEGAAPEELSDEEKSAKGDVEVADEEDEEGEAAKAPKTRTVTEQVAEWKALNDNQALWLRPPGDVSDEEYAKFYKALSKNEWDTPLAHSHFKAEGDVEFKAVMFVPGQATPDLYDNYYARKPSIKLYVRRVFISESFEDLLPKWLSFLVGLVDSDTMPLNVSREMLQLHEGLKVIRKKLVRKAIDMIKKLADGQDRALKELEEKDAAKAAAAEGEEAGAEKAAGEEEERKKLEEKSKAYTKFWTGFGKSLKMGLIEDQGNRRRLLPLLRFHSSKSPDKQISLAQYVEGMKEGQKHIYYLVGTSKEEVAGSPFVESLVEQGYEVLFMTDPLDEYVMQNVQEFEDKEFANVSKEDLKMGDKDEVEKKAQKKAKEEFKGLAKWWKESLGSAVENVKVSKRLATTPCVVVSSKYGWSATMEKIARAQTLGDADRAKYMRGQRSLEINPRHPLIRELKAQQEASPDSAAVKENAQLLYQTCLLESGFMLDDMKDFNARVFRLLAKDMNVKDLSVAREEAEPQGADDGEEDEVAGAAEEEDAAAAGGAEVPDDAELQRMMEQMKDMGMQHTEL